ncbi:MAG: transcriptional regulator [Fibrobacteres bacterium]|nr:transcriptional regulator [Fibrobacterota bacterium]
MDENGCPEGEKTKKSLDCWLQMIRTYDHLQNQVASLLQRHNLTVPQFEVLSTLAIADCTTQQELAERLQVTKGNLVGLIDRLTERGWVERMQVQGDRRVNRVRITEGGKEILKTAFPEQVSAVQTMMSGLEETELDSLRGLLQKLAKND